MKKFLSVLLAVMMVLSTVSFAAPFAVTGIETVGGSVVFASEPYFIANTANKVAVAYATANPNE